MGVGRQLIGYGLVGAVQLAVDWLLFVGLTLLGVAVVPANLAARIAGASLGFWLNGRYTFGGPSTAPLSRGPLQRFVLVWLASTAASTIALQWVDAARGLQAAWLLKPLLDALLAALGFLAARHWIYRAR